MGKRQHQLGIALLGFKERLTAYCKKEAKKLGAEVDDTVIHNYVAAILRPASEGSPWPRPVFISAEQRDQFHGAVEAFYRVGLSKQRGRR